MKRVKPAALLLLSLLILNGCSVSPRPAETSSSAYSADDEIQSSEIAVAGEKETPSETVSESEMPSETAEEPSKSGQAEAPEALRADSPEKEFLLRALWGKLLQRIDSGAPDQDNCEICTDWDRTYEVKAFLEDFTLDTFKYGLSMAYPEHYISSYILFWPDNITDVREVYQTADEEYSMGTYYEGSGDYAADSPWISKCEEESILQITGQVTNEAYALADKLIEEIKPATAYRMWGSVLQEAGRLYQEAFGTILGKFAGKAVLMNFDFEAIAGTYWICLDGCDPVLVTLTFLNGDCGEYTVEINGEASFNETELENGWMGIKFDLTTTQK